MDESSVGMIRAAAEAPYPHCQAQTSPRPVGNSCGDKFGDHTAPLQGSTLDKTIRLNTLDGWIYTRWIMTSRLIDNIPSFCSCGLYFCWKSHASHTIDWKKIHIVSTTFLHELFPTFPEIPHMLPLVYKSQGVFPCLPETIPEKKPSRTLGNPTGPGNPQLAIELSVILLYLYGTDIDTLWLFNIAMENHHF